jgi:hypothetical protein
MKQKNKKMISIILVIIILASLLAGIFFISLKKDEPTTILNLSDQTGFDEIDTSAFEDNNPEKIPVDSEQILGTWKAVSEEFLGKRSENLQNYSITFNEDKTFTSIEEGIMTKGRYELEGDKIVFDADSGIIESWAIIQDNTLTISFPKFPKVVVYQRI